MDKKLLLQEIAVSLAQRANIPADKADAFCRAFFDMIEEGLQQDKYVKIRGFGTFKIITVNERESVNIHTGERIQIGEHDKITFTPDPVIRELINRPFAHFQTVILDEDISMEELENVPLPDFVREDEWDDETEEKKQSAPSLPEQSEENKNNTKEEKEEEEIVSIPSTEDLLAAISAIHHPQEQASTSTPEEKEETVSDASAQDISQKDDEKISDNTEESPITLPTVPVLKEEEEEKKQDDEIGEDSGNEGNEEESLDQQNKPEEDVISSHFDTENQSIHNEMDIQEEDSTSECDGENRTEAESQEGKMAFSITGNHGEKQEMRYVLVEKESIKNTNWWRILALFLFVLLMMGLSYFAGYYKMFCPPCSPVENEKITEGAASCTPSAPAIPVDSARDSVASDSTKIIGESAESAAKQSSSPAKETEQPSSSQPQKETVEKQPKEQDQPKQEDTFHIVKSGENLYAIARRYYGNKDYARLIIKANHIKNPDNITVGQRLLIPAKE